MHFLYLGDSLLTDERVVMTPRRHGIYCLRFITHFIHCLVGALAYVRMLKVAVVEMDVRTRLSVVVTHGLRRILECNLSFVEPFLYVGTMEKKYVWQRNISAAYYFC